MRINQITLEPAIDLEIELDAASTNYILDNYTPIQQQLTQQGYMHVSFNIYSMLRRYADGNERRKAFRLVVETGAAKILCKLLLDFEKPAISEELIAFIESVYSELS